MRDDPSISNLQRHRLSRFAVHVHSIGADEAEGATMSTKPETEPEWWEALVVLLLMPFLITISIPVGAFVLTKLWAWFVVPVFAIKALTLFQAAGLSLLVSFMTVPIASSKFKGLADTLSTWIAGVVFKNGVVLIIGWIIHKFAS